MIADRSHILRFAPVVAVFIFSAVVNGGLGVLILMGAQEARPVLIGFGILVGVPVASLALSSVIHFGLKRYWLARLIMLPSLAITLILMTSLMYRPLLMWLISLVEKLIEAS